MGKILFVSLGSNYDIDLEENFRFIQEFLDKNYEVSVKSVDIKPVPQMKDSSTPNVVVERIQYELNLRKPENIKNFIETKLPNVNDFDEIIICDGTHFTSTEIGSALKKEIESENPQSTVHLFQYISTKYMEPSFNQLRVEKSSLFKGEDFIDQYKDQLLPLFIDPERGERIINQIKRRSSDPKVNGFTVIKLFLNSPAKSALIEEGEKQFKQFMNQYMLDNITFDLINLKPQHGASFNKRT